MSSAASSFPSDGQADPANITQALAKGARRRRAHLREHQGHRHPAGERPRHGRDHRQGQHRRRLCRQLRRPVGSRGRAHGRRQRAADGLRALLRRHRCEPRHSAQPAGAARARRVRLRQGGGRQAAGRLLRAHGQAVGHRRRTRGRRVPHPAGRLGSRRAAAGAGHGAPADPGAHRHPHLLQRSRRASRRTTAICWARRRSCKTSSSLPASTRSASSRPAAPARRWPSGCRPASRPWT